MQELSSELPDDLRDQLTQAVTDYRSEHGVQSITPERIQHAAPSLAQYLWRNTETVETKLHTGIPPGTGIWTNRDMLRANARATKMCWDALIDLTQAATDDHPTETTVRDSLAELVRQLSTIIPDSHKELRQELIAETEEATLGLSRFYVTVGPDIWLYTLASIMPSGWWCCADWPEAVELLASLPEGPPEPETFTDRALNRPWDLSDEQADFVIRRKWKV